MFKNIQDKLLISNPLLWNLRIVPFAAIALCFHIIFFSLGYIGGEVNFNNDDQHYEYSFDGAIIIFFSVIVSILITIVWLVLYSRNNAFKSFYPKTNFSLFKEFLYIALFCGLTSTFALSYLYAKDVRTRTYYSEKEISKKLEILTLSSVFLNGSFEESNYVSVEVDGQYKNQQRENFQYRGRTFSLSSLMNKRAELNTYLYYTEETDSVISKRVKNWLFENKKDSVKWVFDEFMKMAKEENLTSNITSEKWFSLVYDYPEFVNYTVINKSKNQSDYSSYETSPYVDSTGVAVPVENVIASSTYYVPYQSLTDGYKEIAKAYENPTINLESLYFYLYFAIGLSIAIFSFKVTSGRNWLIAMISLGVVSLITGIFSVMSGGTSFFVFYLLIFFGLLIHFFVTLSSRTGKGISGITLNQILWMFPGVIPIIYYFITEISKSLSNYYTNSGSFNDTGISIKESFPKIEWLENNFPEMMIANIAIIILFIFLFSVQIKKWKGIAED